VKNIGYNSIFLPLNSLKTIIKWRIFCIIDNYWCAMENRYKFKIWALNIRSEILLSCILPSFISHNKGHIRVLLADRMGGGPIVFPSKKRLYYLPDSIKEIMRREIVVLGSFMIVLILIAGCSSAQNGAANGSKNQNLAPGYTTIKTKSVSTQSSSPECNLPSPDPITFQKFLPNVPDWTTEAGPNIQYAYHDKKAGMHRDNSICKGYFPVDKSNYNYVEVCFLDMGPCVTETTGVRAFFDKFEIGTRQNTTTSRIENFHGYPAMQILSLPQNANTVFFKINDRLYVIISVIGGDREIFSTKEADMKKFANAIDFKGFAASV
jgi:hypothetical protein